MKSLDEKRLRIAFVKDQFHWPSNCGSDVHGSAMAAEFAKRGHYVTIATFAKSADEAFKNSAIQELVNLSEFPEQNGFQIPAPTRLQRRFERYWGQDPLQLRQLQAFLQDQPHDVVVVLGQQMLPLLRAVNQSLRVWYAADDAALLHWSMFRTWERRTWHYLPLAINHGLYERAYKKHLDRAWVVSARDQRVMQRMTGISEVDLVPNGVNTQYYQPIESEIQPNSCVFWGRLDFGPNIDAIEWFVRRVWPIIRKRNPKSIFTIVGFNPTERVKAMNSQAGVIVKPNVPDLRQIACQNAVVVLPFISGVGIKNKLLEAAALGRPIVCTRRSLSGTRSPAPVWSENSPEGFARAVLGLMLHPDKREQFGQAARQWVIEHHQWSEAAETAEAGLWQSFCGDHGQVPPSGLEREPMAMRVVGR